MPVFKVTLIGDTHLGKKGGYDAGNLKIPDADLIIGMGDLVDEGHEEEYATALRWAKSLKKPFALVKGNHDNGRWNHYARQMCMPEISKKLAEHSPSDNMGITIWKPMIWEEYHATALNLPRKTLWHQLPVDVQNQIIKLKDLTPGYYTFEAGNMIFICLDASDWQLGKKQMEWLLAQVKAADKPVVLVGHFHFLPVDIVFDNCQIHERDFLRKLLIDNKKIIAYLHGHAHKDRWWKYGHADIVAPRARACRTVTFKDGKVVGSELDGKADAPIPFLPRYLCAQCMHPGDVCYLDDPQFTNPWNSPKTSCLAWLKPDSGKEIELDWSMRLPSDISNIPHSLTFQIRSLGNIRLEVSAPGLKNMVKKEIAPSPEGISVDIEIGPLTAGYIEAKLYSTEGWGYVAMAVPINHPADLKL